MKVLVHKSTIRGTVGVPSSKSMTIRALMCAALSRGISQIVHPLVCEDTGAASSVLGQIGVNIYKGNDLWRVEGGRLRASGHELHCGESATTMRFMIAVCALIPGSHTLVGGPSLSQRPVKSLVEALRRLGVRSSIKGKTTPPVTIEGGNFRGEMTELPGNISSQFISALLLIAPFTPRVMSIKLTTPMTSAPYVLMTIWCLKQFGISIQREANRFVVRRQRYKPVRLEIEGDWSSASYFLALGAFSEEGITVNNISTATLQGDCIILDFLRRLGVEVRYAGNSVTVRQGKLKAISADLSDCIDLLPTIAVLAALADGTSEFTGIERARIKESNRLAVVREGLRKLDVDVAESVDRLTIIGLRTPKKVEEDKEEDAEDTAGQLAEPEKKETVHIDSYNDHRIAMAFSIFGVAEGGVTIDRAECVAKTFPEYWKTLKSVGGELDTDE